MCVLGAGFEMSMFTNFEAITAQNHPTDEFVIWHINLEIQIFLSNFGYAHASDFRKAIGESLRAAVDNGDLGGSAGNHVNSERRLSSSSKQMRWPSNDWGPVSDSTVGEPPRWYEGYCYSAYAYDDQYGNACTHYTGAALGGCGFTCSPHENPWRSWNRNHCAQQFDSIDKATESIGQCLCATSPTVGDDAVAVHPHCFTRMDRARLIDGCCVQYDGTTNCEYLPCADGLTFYGGICYDWRDLSEEEAVEAQDAADTKKCLLDNCGEIPCSRRRNLKEYLPIFRDEKIQKRLSPWSIETETKGIGKVPLIKNRALKTDEQNAGPPFPDPYPLDSAAAWGQETWVRRHYISPTSLCPASHFFLSRAVNTFFSPVCTCLLNIFSKT